MLIVRWGRVPRIDEHHRRVGKVADVARDHDRHAPVPSQQSTNRKPPWACPQPRTGRTSGPGHQRYRVKGKARCPNQPAQLASQVVNSLRRREAGRRTMYLAPVQRVSGPRHTNQRTSARPSNRALPGGAQAAPAPTASRCPEGTSRAPHPRSSGRIGSGERCVSSGSPRAPQKQRKPAHPRQRVAPIFRGRQQHHGIVAPP